MTVGYPHGVPLRSCTSEDARAYIAWLSHERGRSRLYCLVIGEQ